MDKDQFLSWCDCVESHMEMVDTSIKDRRFLKSKLEEHLSQFFKWRDIDYNRDLSVVELECEGMFIDSEKMMELLMPWRIESNGCGYDTFRIIVYPFGVPNEEED